MATPCSRAAASTARASGCSLPLCRLAARRSAWASSAPGAGSRPAGAGGPRSACRSCRRPRCPRGAPAPAPRRP
jgi:hypothetical protein